MRQIEFDIASDWDGLGALLHSICKVVESPETNIAITPRGPGGGNPCIVLVLDETMDERPVIQVLKNHRIVVGPNGNVVFEEDIGVMAFTLDAQMSAEERTPVTYEDGLIACDVKGCDNDAADE